MRWQKTARLAIATFVILFAGIVFWTMRQRTAGPATALEITRVDEAAQFATSKGVDYSRSENGRLVFRLVADRHLGYADGRHRIADVQLTLPDKDGKTILIKADEAYLTNPPGKELTNATFKNNVRLTTSDGVEIRTDTADYLAATGVITIPGPVAFSRGRMTGKGVGATYDQARDVLWLLTQVHITVAPDATGNGAAEATSETAGLARRDNYLKLSRNAHVVSADRTITTNELTAMLKPGTEIIERAELRGNSRITETGPAARTMSANDIDLQYAADGRTLQNSRLMENAVVDLAPQGASGRRISGRTIDMVMGPDGQSLSALNASERVEVALPAEGGAPDKVIRSNTLQSTGASGEGLDNATFTGAVEYRETAPARGTQAAIDRTVRSMRLTINTKPGLGEIDKADFRGKFRFESGTTTAEAPRGLYFVNNDRIELSPSEGDPGPTPYVNDGQLLVEARNIQVSPTSRKLTADTNVRSTIQPKRKPEAGSRGIAPVGSLQQQDQGRLPIMLKPDRPVYVAANRLSYDGTAEATYTGSARLWQDQSQSKIDAETLILNDRTGNLTARTNVSTSMLLEDVDPKTKKQSLSQTHATSDLMVYDDAKRLAVYTGTKSKQANMKGPYGDVTSDRIDLFLKESGNELERAEAHGSVLVKESARIVTGDVLVYTSADDTYVMKGKPVEAIEQDAPNSCKKTTGTTLTFQRSVGSIRAGANDLVPVRVERVPCPAERRN